MATQIQLNESNSIDLLKKYIDIGYRTGTVSIKEGAIIYKWFNILKKVETDDSITTKQIYQNIIALIGQFNVNKAYGLDDAANLFQLVTFVENNQLKEETEVVKGKEV